MTTHCRVFLRQSGSAVLDILPDEHFTNFFIALGFLPQKFWMESKCPIFRFSVWKIKSKIYVFNALSIYIIFLTSWSAIDISLTAMMTRLPAKWFWTKGDWEDIRWFSLTLFLIILIMQHSNGNKVVLGKIAGLWDIFAYISKCRIFGWGSQLEKFWQNKWAPCGELACLNILLYNSYLCNMGCIVGGLQCETVKIDYWELWDG